MKKPKFELRFVFAQINGNPLTIKLYSNKKYKSILNKHMVFCTRGGGYHERFHGMNGFYKAEPSTFKLGFYKA